MKRLLLTCGLLYSIATYSVTLTPPYLATDYESDEVYQVCSTPDINKKFTCSLLNKVEFYVKPDGRVVSGEMQIEFAPDSTGALVGTVTHNQLITVDCNIKNISYGSDEAGWSPWAYLEPNTIGHSIMDKACTLKK